MSDGPRFPEAIYTGSYPHLHEGIEPFSLIPATKARANDDLGCSYTRRINDHPYQCPACSAPLYRAGGEVYHHKRAYFWHGTGGTCAHYHNMSEALAFHRHREKLFQFDHAIWTGACEEAHQGYTVRGLIPAEAAKHTSDLRHLFGLPEGEHAYRCPDPQCGRPVYKAGNLHHGDQRPHFRHVGDDESCAPGGKETKLHYMLKESIARVLNAREGVTASVEHVMHAGSRIIPDVSVTFEDGRVVYVEVVVHHRPEFEVVPVLAPNLLVVRAIDFPLGWIHQTDEAADAVAEAVERLHAGLSSVEAGRVDPAMLTSQHWTRYGRGYRGRWFAVPQFLDVIGRGMFRSASKQVITGQRTVTEVVSTRVIRRPIYERHVRISNTRFYTCRQPVTTSWVIGAKKQREPGTLREITVNEYGYRTTMQVVGRIPMVETYAVRVGTDVTTNEVMGEVQRPVYGRARVQRFFLDETEIFDIVGDEAPTDPILLEDCDMHHDREEVETLVSRAVMVQVNRTLATELQERLTAYEQAEEAP